MNGIGVDVLFKNIGKKLIDLSYKNSEENEDKKDNNNINGNQNTFSSDIDRIKLDSDVDGETKNNKYCCGYY